MRTSESPVQQERDQPSLTGEQPRTDSSVEPSDEADDPNENDQSAPEEQQTIEIPDAWKRLSKEHEIWVDMKNKQVMVAGNIVLRGPLEMFVCPRRTKEHESVISVNALASEIHAALIAIGANPGTPVQWDPKYVPASGPVIDVRVMWKDQDKVIKRRGQEMIRDFETQKPMQHEWVFGGSQVYTDQETGTTYYYGDGGELICLSNFSTATMDLTIQSSDSNDSLMFEAFTENIPEIGTKVYVVMSPQLEKKNEVNPSAERVRNRPTNSTGRICYHFAARDDVALLSRAIHTRQSWVGSSCSWIATQPDCSCHSN